MPPVWQGHDLADLYDGKISAPNLMAAHYLAHFFLGSAGSGFGLGPNEKIDLFNKFSAHSGAVPGHAGVMNHIFLADRFLNMAVTVAGDLVACGAFKGSYVTSLSHLADRARRRLIICDSFLEASAGSRAEVEANIRKFGVIDRVDFIEGLELASLKRPIAFAFIDVDQPAATRDCLRAIWPLLSPGGVIVTADAPDLTVAKVYFDDVWWRENLGCDAPGLIGAGCGVWVSATGAPGQGYCVKP